jgi:PAS domain-containing protein
MKAEEQRAVLEETLRKVAAEWTTTFDAIPIGILLVDRNGRVRRLNDAARSMAGQCTSAGRWRSTCADVRERAVAHGRFGRGKRGHGTAARAPAGDRRGEREGVGRGASLLPGPTSPTGPSSP